MFEPPKLHSNIDKYKLWLRAGRKARAIIGLSLSNDELEHVQESEAAKEIWQAILKVFRRHSFLSKLATRRNFYTVSIAANEFVLFFLKRVKQFVSILKDMGVAKDNKELAIGVPNSLPKLFEHLTVALDALGNDDEKFTCRPVKSRLSQKEQRSEMRNTFHQNSDSSLLLNRHSRDRREFQRTSRARCPFKCTYRGRTGHTQDSCCSKKSSSKAIWSR